MLRATTTCTFSTSQLPKVVRTASVLYILTWKCASRDNGVQFFISHLASWLRTRRFSEPTFRPSGASKHWKNTVLRGFPFFSRICIFFLLTLSLLLISLLIFSLLSDSALLCFSSVHIVGSLTSKLPSIIVASPLAAEIFTNFTCKTGCIEAFPQAFQIEDIQIIVSPGIARLEHDLKMFLTIGCIFFPIVVSVFWDLYHFSFDCVFAPPFMPSL